MSRQSLKTLRAPEVQCFQFSLLVQPAHFFSLNYPHPESAALSLLKSLPSKVGVVLKSLVRILQVIPLCSSPVLL
jgi:hypothetical protein